MPAMNVISNLTATATMNLKERLVYVFQWPSRCLHFFSYEYTVL